MDIAHLVYPLIHWWTRELCSLFGYCICLHTHFNYLGYIPRSRIDGLHGNSVSLFENYQLLFTALPFFFSVCSPPLHFLGHILLFFSHYLPCMLSPHSAKVFSSTAGLLWPSVLYHSSWVLKRKVLHRFHHFILSVWELVSAHLSCVDIVLCKSPASCGAPLLLICHVCNTSLFSVVLYIEVFSISGPLHVTTSIWRTFHLCIPA